MGLYRNIIQWDWNLEDRPEVTGETGLFPPHPAPPPNHPTVGEFVSWVKYPFNEYNLDPIFKVIHLHSDYTADIEVLYSTKITEGTLYTNQPLQGLRRVKLSTLEEITSSAHSPSGIEPQPTPIQILRYKKGY